MGQGGHRKVAAFSKDVSYPIMLYGVVVENGLGNRLVYRPLSDVQPARRGSTGCREY
jgi:hypothetical protein